ncbi:MAG: serine/threonine-protein phosphatase [Cocleimonas sp.]|nr:serine/threonine-protein phosphatase [Cocleimonas sp.]
MDTIISEPRLPSPSISQPISLSDRGPREENQDNYLVINGQGQCEYLLNEKVQTRQLKHWAKGHLRLVVADGMGGHNNGRQAAEAVVQALLALDFQHDPEQLRDALLTIHNELFNKFHQGARTPGSTLVMADIDLDGRAVIANIGDSRVYRYHDDSWTLLTTDHSEAEFAYRDSEISQQAYERILLQNTNRITQAMIFGSSGIIAHSSGVKYKRHVQELRVELNKDVFTQQLNTGDVLMLASDGVWSGQTVYSPALLAAEADLNQYAQQQMKDALEQTRDNVSLVVCRL